jgi:hypothetical protein
VSEGKMGNIKILVVENLFSHDKDIKNLWKSILSSYEYRLEQKISKSIIIEFTPDIIFLDSEVYYEEEGRSSEKSWNEICEIIYDKFNLKNIKILVITGASIYDSRRAAEIHEKYRQFLGVIPNAHESEVIKGIDKIIREYILQNKFYTPEIERIKTFGDLKHRLMRLLGPIDTDLQALWDDAERTGRNGFDPEKWKEVCESYKDYKEDEILQLSLKMIKESIDEIKESLTGTKKESAERLKTAIENKVKKIEEVLSFIKEGDMNKVYEMLKKECGLNPIHKFLIELDKELDSLI